MTIERIHVGGCGLPIKKLKRKSKTVCNCPSPSPAPSKSPLTP